MKRITILLTVIITILLLNVQTGYSLPQAIYTVDRSDDAGGLACTSAANDCTLRSAIEKANASPANDSVLFDSGRTITLTGPLPELTDAGTLIAAWPSQDVNIDLNGAANAFTISGDNVSISGLDIYGGSTTVSALIIIKGAAENIKIYDNLIGDYWDGAITCGTYQGGVTGIHLLADNPAPSGVRLYVYGNEIRCLSIGISPAGSNAVVGENDSGNAGTDQKNRIFANTHGIVISGGSAGGDHRIRNNDIYAQELTGISIDNSSGTHIYGNNIYNNGTDGIYLVNGARANTIGCALFGSFDAARRNYIYGNGRAGIWISGVTSTSLVTRDNYVACNYIGLKADGSADGNQYGVYLSNGAVSNYIGSTADKGNAIGGNTSHGVVIDGGSNSNLVQGNFIGALPDGSTDRGNGGSGIAIWGASQLNIIGGANAANANTIVFNNTFGIHLLDAGGQNEIRRTLVGNLGRPNTVGGIAVVNTNQTLIGTGFTCTDVSGFDCLLVYANGINGISLYQANNTLIAAGTHIFRNGADGIRIENSSNNNIFPQYMGDNTGAGISVAGASAGNNIGVTMRIYDNGGPPIDLNGDGFTPNDPGDTDSGPNGLLNFPVTTSPAGSVSMSGTACNGCVVNVYRYSETAGYYAFLDGVVADNITGIWTFDLSSYGVTQDEAAFTATDAALNTSEMSPLGGVVSYSLFLPVIVK